MASKLGPGTVLRSLIGYPAKVQSDNDRGINQGEGDEGDVDSEFEEAEQSTHFRNPTNPLLIADWAILTCRPSHPFARVGPWLDAFVWPRRSAQKSDEDVDEDEDEVESFNNRRLMRLGAFRFKSRMRAACPIGRHRLQATTLGTLSHPDRGSITRRTTKGPTKRTTMSLSRRRSSRAKSACRSTGLFGRSFARECECRAQTLRMASKPYPCAAYARPSSRVSWKEFLLSRAPYRNAQRLEMGDRWGD